MVEEIKNLQDFITLKDVYKYYGQGENKLAASNGVNFNIKKGEFCVILGPSGAGKTTILNLLGGMESSSSGEVVIDNENIAKYSNKQLTSFRRRDVGFVFQFYNLMANLTALENVEIAVELCKDYYDPAKTLEKVGLKNHLNKFPVQLSGGEQQRVAIARALAKKPKVLLCDEPTGALDYQTGKQVLEVLYGICREDNMTTLVITHNHVISEMADRVIVIKNGQVESEKINSNPKNIKDLEW